MHHKTLKDDNGKVLKDKEGNKITKPVYSFEKNEDKIAKDRAKAGYFASVAYKVEGDALQHLKTYKLRDEQEKYFFTMKDLCHFDTVKKSNELSRKGGLFIMFVGLIVMSYIKWKWGTNNKLKEKYTSIESVFKTMQPIRYVNGNGTYHMTQFTSEQVEICKTFGIEPPIECLNATDHKKLLREQQPKKKRGCPKKLK